ncbi:hypothetical protein GCM10010372_51040 [Streptomyces tauricus]|nr:hypothetical protein GCM10010372_51040 [Streptomyces tauricus]
MTPRHPVTGTTSGYGYEVPKATRTAAAQALKPLENDKDRQKRSLGKAVDAQEPPPLDPRQLLRLCLLHRRCGSGTNAQRKRSRARWRRR